MKNEIGDLIYLVLSGASAGGLGLAIAYGFSNLAQVAG